MIRCASILASVLLVGCVSARGNDLLVDLPREGTSRGETRDGDSASLAALSEGPAMALAAGPEAPLPTAEALEPSLQAPRVVRVVPPTRFTVKGGYYSSEDADELDDGYIINFSWMQFMSPNFALEFEFGYFDADGDDSGVEGEVWGLPAMFNGRLNVPVGPLDIYGGAGLGNIYYDGEVDAGIVSVDADGWVFAGDAFLGATIDVGETLALGLEGKYYLTEEIDSLDVSLDSFALMVTLGFGRHPR